MFFRMYSWLENYLSHLTHYVQTDYSTSILPNVASGVPQEAGKGPLLFLYITGNNIHSNVTKCIVPFYAHNTILYSLGTTPNLGLTQLQVAFNTVACIRGA